jgi:molybdopterin-containing oxidoreductase family membrane subunit
MRNLLGIFVAATLFFTAILHMTNAYFAKNVGFESFLLFNSEFSAMFWVGQVLLGSLLPIYLIYSPAGNKRGWITIASLLIIFGAFCQLYVFIIGGQAYPLDIFPGYDVTSSFADGAINHYTPSVPEFFLSIGGIGIAFTVTVVGVRLLRVMPRQEALEKLEEDDSDGAA